MGIIGAVLGFDRAWRGAQRGAQAEARRKTAARNRREKLELTAPLVNANARLKGFTEDQRAQFWTLLTSRGLSA
jgi:hypothetical protein